MAVHLVLGDQGFCLLVTVSPEPVRVLVPVHSRCLLNQGVWDDHPEEQRSERRGKKGPVC